MIEQHVPEQPEQPQMQNMTGSAILKMNLEDLKEMYLTARQNGNEARMEKISKTMAEQIRKIRDQETYEKETVSRAEFMALMGAVGGVIGGAHDDHMTDDEVRTKIIDQISDGINGLAGETFSNV